jgi:hypothetical protein
MYASSPLSGTGSTPKVRPGLTGGDTSRR